MISYGGIAAAEREPLQSRPSVIDSSGIEEIDGSETYSTGSDPAPPLYLSSDEVNHLQRFMDHRNSQRNFLHLIGEEVLRLRRRKVIQKLPAISEDHIYDKSKSDSFAKPVVGGQILWNVIQIIARTVQHLPVSQLEVAVLACSACAVIIYGMT